MGRFTGRVQAPRHHFMEKLDHIFSGDERKLMNDWALRYVDEEKAASIVTRSQIARILEKCGSLSARHRAEDWGDRHAHLHALAPDQSRHVERQEGA